MFLMHCFAWRCRYHRHAQYHITPSHPSAEISGPARHSLCGQSIARNPFVIVVICVLQVPGVIVMEVTSSDAVGAAAGDQPNYAVHDPHFERVVAVVNCAPLPQVRASCQSIKSFNLFHGGVDKGSNSVDLVHPSLGAHVRTWVH